MTAVTTPRISKSSSLLTFIGGYLIFAESNFGSSGKYLSLNSISSVFDSVQKKQSKYGIIPLENNQEGIVQETVDLLGSSQLKIIAELPMSISLSFSTRADDVKKVRKIYSKDIAFKQCKDFIENYFDEKVELIPDRMITSLNFEVPR